MAFLVDTSVFIAIERQGTPPESVLIHSHGEPMALSAVTASELLVGIHRTVNVEQSRYREGFVTAVLELLPVLPFDLQAARVHAAVYAELQTRGQTIGAHDLLIAATAIANGYTVLTHNLRDFQRVPGLEVRQPLG